jgi:uncharacterized protein YabE (DUF348 family)
VLAAVCVVGVLAGLALGLRQTRSPVILYVEGQRFEILTNAETVGAALRQAGFDLYPEDLISPGVEAPLEAGTTVHIERSHPVLLRADGEFAELRTRADTVAEFLAEAGIALRPADEVYMGDQLVDPTLSLQLELPLPPKLTRDGWLPARTRARAADPPVISLRRAASLVLDDGGVVTTLYTTADTVGQALYEHGVELFLGDQVTPGLQEPVSSGLSVQILRSVPVKIEVDGDSIRTRTRADTVAGVLGQEGIALQGRDRVEPALPDPVRPGMTIRVIRVREDFAIEFEPIPFETVWVADSEVEIDTVRMVQAGQLGLTKRRHRVVLEDGHEVARFLEDVWSAQQPVTKTMAYGTKIVVRTMDTPDGPIEYWRKMRVYTVSYTAASSGKSRSDPRYGYTRLGWKATKGVVAVDPTVIPLRTRMYVPGYGFARAGDTGGGIKGKLVDLCFDVGNYQSWHWWSDIYLLTPVPPPSQIRWVLPNWPRFPDRNHR